MLGKCMQFITGHAHMNRHQNLVDSSNDEGDTEVTQPTCRLCKRGEETPYHIILDCDEMADDSNYFLGQQDSNRDPRNFQLKWNPHKLTGFLSLTNMEWLLGGDDPNVERAEEEENQSSSSSDTSMSIDDSIDIHPSEY